MTDDDPRCPACCEPIDYCQGHGEVGDPIGFRILMRHDDDDHSMCQAKGCDVAQKEEQRYLDEVRECCGGRDRDCVHFRHHPPPIERPEP